MQAWEGAALQQHEHRIHVVIVDSFAVVRQCLPWALSRLAEDIDVVSVTGSGVEAVSVIRDLRPDIVLLGLTLPDLSGLEVAQRVYETQPAVKFIAFTERNDAATLRELRRLGVSGYLAKREGPYRIAQVIRAVAAGQTFWPPSTVPPSVAHPDIVLTERQAAVLTLLDKGRHNKEIAAALHLTPATVEYHVHNLFLKLDAHSRGEVLRKAREHGLL